MRPLDRVPSIKMKLGAIIVAAVAGTTAAVVIGLQAELGWVASGLFAAVIGLAAIQFLARGMTSPLREMAAAARGMARGDYSRRVAESSRDEVGELARAFNKMAADLAEVDRVRKDLVANVSHELRTPITALQVVLENLVDGVEEPNLEALRTMLAQVDRLDRLIDQLLDLSRLESGVLRLDKDNFVVRPLLEQVVAEVGIRGRGDRTADVKFEIRVDPKDLVIFGDAERVHQVVANLIDNAIRHSPEDGIVLLQANGRDGWARLSVTDEGPGIPEEDVPRVFERFYRTDSGRSSAEGGTGLGLAIARWIVDLHGGHIRVERGHARGCCMVVDLPMRAA